MSTVAQLLVKVGSDTTGAEQGLARVNKSVQDTASNTGILSKAFGGLTSGLGSIGLAAQGVSAIFATVAGGLNAALAPAMSFEKTMSGVQAVLSPTGAEFEALSQKALQLGADTAFSASEAASAIELLAQNGLNAAQIMGGAADATTALAAATDADLVTAATVATDTMAAFGLEASEMMSAVDGITGVTVASKFGINDYALALSNGGGAAAAFGVSLDDFNAVITATSTQFTSGQTAGTAFRTFINRLTPSTDEATAAMAELGLMTDNGTSAFYTATGAIKPMADVAELLKGAFGGLTDAQKAAYVETIFGAEAIGTVIGLTEQGADGVNQFAAAIDKVDAAGQAATRLDNMSGALEAAKGSMETLGITVGSLVLPSLKAFFNDTITPGINSITTWVGTIASAEDPLAALSASLSGAASGIGDFLSGISAADVGATLSAFISKFYGLETQFLTVAQTWLAGLLSGLLEDLPSLMAGAGTIVTTILDTLATVMPGLIEVAGRMAATVGNFVVESIPILIRGLGSFLATVGGWFVENLPSIAAKAAEWAGALASWALDAIPKLIANLGELFGEFLIWFVNNQPLIDAKLAEWGKSFGTWITTVAIPAIVTELGMLWGKLTGWLSEKATAIAADGSIGRALVDGIKKGISDAWGSFMGYLSSKMAEIPEPVRRALGINSPAKVMVPIGKGIIEGVVLGITQANSLIVQTLTGVASNIIDEASAFSQAGAKLMGDLGKGIEGGSVAVQAMFDSVLAGFGGSTEDATAEIGDNPENKSVGQNIINGIINGIDSKGSALENKLKDMANSALSAAKSALGIASPSKAFTEVGAFSMDGWVQGILGGISRVVSAIRNVSSAMVAEAFSLQAQFLRAKAQNNISIEDMMPLDDKKFRNLESRIHQLQQAIDKGENVTKNKIKLEQSLALRAQMLAATTKAQEQLNQAEQESVELRKVDTGLANEYYNLRAKQILEIAKLEDEKQKAKKKADKDRIQAQIDLLKSAQDAELEAFKAHIQEVKDVLAKQIQDTIKDIADRVNNLMRESLAGIAGLARGRAGTRRAIQDMLPDTGALEDMKAKLQELTDEEALLKITAANNIDPEKRANAEKRLLEIAKERAELDKEYTFQAQKQRLETAIAQRAQEALAKAEQEALELRKIDPQLADEYYQLKSDQILELAKLEQELAGAKTQTEADAIKEQMRFVKEAQDAEMQLFNEQAVARKKELEQLAKDAKDATTDIGYEFVAVMQQGLSAFTTGLSEFFASIGFTPQVTGARTTNAALVTQNARVGGQRVSANENTTQQQPQALIGTLSIDARGSTMTEAKIRQIVMSAVDEAAKKGKLRGQTA